MNKHDEFLKLQQESRAPSKKNTFMRTTVPELIIEELKSDNEDDITGDDLKDSLGKKRFKSPTI